MKTIKYLSPELISPAGDWPSLQSAIDAGADAVYFGAKELNMRLAADNFDLLEMSKVIALLHKNGKKGYLTINTIVYEKEITKVKKILLRAKDCGVDAVIAWDMGVLSLAHEFDVPVHLSTQASVSNSLSLRLFSRLGIKRIVLARECSLADIKDIIVKIKKQNLGCEIEVFIHGAMCVSISGRCLLSEYSFRKSANRGECLQPCRREYLIKDVTGPDEYIVGKGYCLSAKDLCTIDCIDQLIEAGVRAFKIEGRMRSPEYTLVVTSVYRKAIDAFFKGELSVSLKKSLRKELETVFNRGFDSGFYFGEPSGEESLLGAHGYEKIFLGEVTNFYNRISVAEVILRNQGLCEGDEVLIFGKSTAASFLRVSELQIKHQMVKQAYKGDLVGIKTALPAKPKDKVFLWRKRTD
ncbi:MAG: peptidase U32 family protein [Candidatus Omnitrophota bacterium]|jgi:putative protease